MVNEINLPKMSRKQILAMERFQRSCHQAMLRVVLIATVVIAVVLLVTRLNPQSFPLIIIVWVMMVAYPSLLIVAIRARTGLWWHVLNAHAVWVGLSFILLILV